MPFAGLTTDIFVASIDDAREFYRLALGRDEDLMPGPDTLEWILHPSPQIALRVVQDRSAAGGSRVGIGVDDIDRERERLSRALDEVPDVDVVPGVIALLEIGDQDGNSLVFWQDLLGS